MIYQHMYTHDIHNSYKSLVKRYDLTVASSTDVLAVAITVDHKKHVIIKRDNLHRLNTTQSPVHDTIQRHVCSNSFMV